MSVYTTKQDKIQEMADYLTDLYWHMSKKDAYRVLSVKYPEHANLFSDAYEFAFGI
jgi:hypothetical protein